MQTPVDKVKILILGDSGVGKTSFVRLAAYNEPIRSPSWTIGCSVEVKLHEFKEGTKDQKTYFIEFWDVGGSNNHRNACQVFYGRCNGVILIHDLTNRKSEENLEKWLKELLNYDNNNGSSEFSSVLSCSDEYDMENMMGASNMMPILVVGTKLDQIDDNKRTSNLTNNSFRHRYNSEEILLDCRQFKYLAAGTSNAVKLSRFYDKVIEHSLNDRRVHSERQNSLSSLPNYNNAKFYSLLHQD